MGTEGQLVKRFLCGENHYGTKPFAAICTSAPDLPVMAVLCMKQCCFAGDSADFRKLPCAPPFCASSFFVSFDFRADEVGAKYDLFSSLLEVKRNRPIGELSTQSAS